jgi:hypothetical protein
MSINTIWREGKIMHSSVIGRWFLIFLALLMFVSCSRGGKIEADKAKSTKSATKTAVTGTNSADSAPKRTTSKKTDFDFNGVTQFHEP